ncbi:hypothetical protein NX059_002785 [Plenodomus lindquistii]|nr:hypothetical protein NX059_002785 [Plenodomus lindquistii]
MPTQASVLLEHYGSSDRAEAMAMAEKLENAAYKPDTSTSTLKLPYYSLGHPKIPTVPEIKAAFLERQKTSRWHSIPNVCWVGDVFIKFGRHLDIIQEGEDLLFLKENSRVRVPTLYAAFFSDNMYFIVMEKIAGEELNTGLYLSLDAANRRIIADKLAEQIRLLRETPLPEVAYYGRVHNQGWYSSLALLRTRYEKPCGPYADYKEFCTAVLKAAQLHAARDLRKFEEVPELLEPLLELEAKMETWDSTPVFTHIDPAFKNIIVRKVETSDGPTDWEVTLIDWAHCGWYPAWMQAVAFSILRIITIDYVKCSGISHDEERREIMEVISQSYGKSRYDEEEQLMNKVIDTLDYGIH